MVVTIVIICIDEVDRTLFDAFLLLLTPPEEQEEENDDNKYGQTSDHPSNDGADIR
jgi:hypothetical protein